VGIPVNIVTGFLGSGKTTLLGRLLRSPDMADTAVLVNELGEIGLDHELLNRLDEQTAILPGGCVCCAVRDDLSRAVRDLYGRRERGEIPQFRRLVIETTGLADPAPLLRTFLADPVLRHHFRLGKVITTLDAVHGEDELARHAETVRQVIAADRIVVTKTDLVPEQQAALVEAHAHRLNPTAGVMRVPTQALDPAELLDADTTGSAGESAEALRWTESRLPTEDVRPDAPDAAGHHAGIYAACMCAAEPLDWSAFGLWLSMLLNRYGQQVLRMKALLNVAGLEAPVLAQSVQHTIHAPVHLGAWPSEDRRSRIVIIVDGLPRRSIEASLAVHCGIATRPSAPEG